MLPTLAWDRAILRELVLHLSIAWTSLGTLVETCMELLNQGTHCIWGEYLSMVTLQVTKSQSVFRVFTEIFKKLQIVLQITVKHVVLLLNFVTMRSLVWLWNYCRWVQLMTSHSAKSTWALAPKPKCAKRVCNARRWTCGIRGQRGEVVRLFIIIVNCMRIKQA